MLASGARFPADRLRSSLRASRGGAAPAKAYRVAMGVAELGRQRKGCFRAVNSKSGRLGVADRHHDLALPSWSMSSPTPTILLDLDGTPIDSQPGILSSCRAALRALGHEPEASLDISAIIGPPIDDVMRALLESYADDRIAEAVAAYRADYGQMGYSIACPTQVSFRHWLKCSVQALAYISQHQSVRCSLSKFLNTLISPSSSTASMDQRQAAHWTTSLN
jgi:hypothetical protein